MEDECDKFRLSPGQGFTTFMLIFFIPLSFRSQWRRIKKANSTAGLSGLSILFQAFIGIQQLVLNLMTQPPKPEMHECLTSGKMMNHPGESSFMTMTPLQGVLHAVSSAYLFFTFIRHDKSLDTGSKDNKGRPIRRRSCLKAAFWAYFTIFFVPVILMFFGAPTGPSDPLGKFILFTTVVMAPTTTLLVFLQFFLQLSATWQNAFSSSYSVISRRSLLATCIVFWTMMGQWRVWMKHLPEAWDDGDGSFLSVAAWYYSGGSILLDYAGLGLSAGAILSTELLIGLIPSPAADKSGKAS